MPPLLRLATALLFGLFALAGCAAGDVEETRLCRLVAATLAEPDERVEVERQTAGPADAPGERRVRIDVAMTNPAGDVRSEFAICRFHGAGLAPSLTAVATRRETYSDIKLFMLKRFWLDAPESAAADPDPFGGARAPRAPRPVAIALQHAVNAIPPSAIYALLAGAYALVYGLVGRVNLAFGEFAAAAGYAAFFGLALLPWPWAGLALGIGLALWTSVLLGVVTGRAVFQPLRRAAGFPILVATVGLATALQEGLRLTQGAAPRLAAPFLSTPFPLAQAEGFVATATPVAALAAGVAALVSGAVLIALRRSRFGRDWRAFAQDPLAAQLCGVSPGATFMRTFALASGLAGLAGALLTAWHGSVGANAATALGLKAMTGAIIGGFGSVGGAMLGGAAIGLMETLWSALFPIAWRDAAVYTLLAMVLALRPGGLFGDAEEASGRRKEARDREGDSP
jgi:branched-chain amino acid transport system permease protein